MELVLHGSDGRVLCQRCTLADNPLTRARGLMGRSGLASDEGMFLATRAIHTWFMRFPIDVLFLDRENRIVDIAHSLQPWHVALRRKARSVIELPAGACEALELRPGTQLALRPPSSKAGGEAIGDGLSRSLRVAVASEDGRFRRVSSFLLARHGYQVTSYKDLHAVSDEREGSDVVVFDGSRSLAAAARAVRRMTAARPETGIVVVADAADRQRETPSLRRTLEVVPKWESFDRLAEAIREAAAGREHV